MCPHGMPAGSCPICNGMSGGGAISKRNDVRKPGEMSWSECFAMGLRLKADKLHRQQLIQQHIEAQRIQLQLQEKLYNATIKLERLTELANKLLPSPVNKIAATTLKYLALPVLKTLLTINNFTQTINQNIQNIFAGIKENLQGLQEKLAAIFGEIFNAKEKNISERLKLARKKIFSIFFKGETEEELEIKEIEKSEREIELKKVKDTSLNLTKYKKEIKETQDEHSCTI